MHKGFTIIEILIAMFIFIVIAGAAVSLFISSLASQRYVLSSQRLADEVSLFMESLSRALREAQRDSGGGCLAANYNYEEFVAPGPGIKFLTKESQCREIALLADQRIYERIDFGTWNALTSEGISIENLEFNLIGQEGGATDNMQPRVTALVEAVAKNFPGGGPPRIKLQTTISQRDLDEP